MKSVRPVCFALIGTVCLVIAAIPQTSGGKTFVDKSIPGQCLTLAEEDILRNPYPSRTAAQRLLKGLEAVREARRKLALLPLDQQPMTADSGGMGWAVPDEEYLSQIPSEARTIPANWSNLNVIRFTNKVIDGPREIRLSVQGEYDFWLLSDPMHEITACISVHRPTRRVWFFEISRTKNGAWAPKRAKDSCYTCHPSGTRLVRPLPESGLDGARLAQFNRRMLSYGACNFGESVNNKTRGSEIADIRCTGCHNGTDRGKLYGTHAPLIRFKTEVEATMPPSR